MTEEFENILFDPNRTIVERNHNSEDLFVKALYDENGNLLASMTITSEGTECEIFR
jgi:hypothetical protein